MIPPPAYRHDEGEAFPGYTGLIFDPVGAAEAAADFAVGEILHPNRMARLLVFGSMGDYPGLEEVADRVIEHTWGADAAPDAYRQRVLHAIQRSVADRMMQQASQDGNAAEVRAVLSDRLEAARRGPRGRCRPRRRINGWWPRTSGAGSSASKTRCPAARW